MASVDSLPTSAPDPESDPAGPGRENPFADDVCRSPWDIGSSVEALNSEVLDDLIETVGAGRSGPMKLLTAPRAGYGKTHLLSRIAAATAGQVVIVPVAFRSGDPITLTSLTRRGIESLLEASDQDRPGWTRLREYGAQVIVTLLRRLIESGQLACANPAQALSVLSGPVQEVFDATGRAQRIGEWLAHNRGGLRGPLALLAARELPLRAELLDGWMSALLDQSLEGGFAGVAEMQELCGLDHETSVPSWLRLMDLWRPVVLLIDHLDGFYRNPEAGIRIASLLMELVEAHRMHVLISLNQDVWQATFGHHLPGALEDRLTASQVLLRGLSETDATALLRLRLNQTGLDDRQKAEFESFIDVKRHFLGRPVGSVSARAFLRHCSRQWNIFHHTPPSGALPPPDPADDEEFNTHLPLMKDRVEEEEAPALPLPTLFDPETASDVQKLAGSLAEPRHALPQDEAPPVFIPPPPTPVSVPAPTPPPFSEAEAEATSADLTNTVEDWGAGNSLGVQEGVDVPPGPDAFVKLREMLSKLRQPGHPPGPAAPQETAHTPDSSSPPEAFSTPAPASSSSTVLPPPRSAPTAPADALQGRFQALRMQHQAEAMAQPLDHGRLADIIRLAGRRFPLVRYSEHELPGLTGRHALYWSLQGIELLFGLAPPGDAAYWRTLSGFAAGRLADLSAQAERESHAPVKLKLLGFKTERDQFAWQGILQSQFFPPSVRQSVDIVHLDVDGLAALYAMQRLVKESESGVLQAEPAQIISTLARELDFFWKRITRTS